MYWTRTTDWHLFTFFYFIIIVVYDLKKNYDTRPNMNFTWGVLTLFSITGFLHFR